MNSIATECLYSATDLVKIIKACGDSGVTEFRLNGIQMSLKPKYVAEAEVSRTAQDIPVQLPLPVFAQEEVIEDLAFTNPAEWQRQGLKGDVTDET